MRADHPDVDASPVRLLLVDVPPPRAWACLRALEHAGWAVQAETAEGPDELAAGLLRRGWDAVLHGGAPAGRVPLTKAMALARLADAHMPVVSVDPGAPAAPRAGDGTSVAPRDLPAFLGDALATAAGRRESGTSHRLLAAQQGVADHLAAAPDPKELLRRVLGTLGDTLGWTFGAVWRPHGDAAELRCAVGWHAAGADARVAGFASLSRTWTFAPGRGLPGRVWAFQRPSWITDVTRDATELGAHAARAGLAAAVAFPLVAGDTPLGVAELWSAEPHGADPEVSALLGAVGRQTGSALARWERAEGDRRRLELLLAAAAARRPSAR